jgi:DNA-binding Xre family transcriptional regulator
VYHQWCCFVASGFKRLLARFYRTDSGREPVREWLKGPEPDDRRVIALVRSLGQGIWEARSSLVDGRIAWLLFCIESDCNGAVARPYEEHTEDAAARDRSRRQAAERRGRMTKKNIESTFDSFLREEGIYEVVSAGAIKRVVARQLEKAMEEKNISKAEMARRMHTSRSALDRLLDPDNDAISLGTLQKAAAAVGRQLRLELV